MILILSNSREDGHIRPVTQELTRRGTKYRIYDPARYPLSSTVTVEKLTCGVRTTIRIDSEDVELCDVKGVWYRRPGNFELPAELSGEESAWVRTECAHLMRAVWAETRGVWVSEPDAIRRASLKITQMRVAGQLGFAVPRFIVTNDVARATDFIRSCPNRAVVKVLAKPLIVFPEHAVSFYTHLVTPADEELIESVRYGPTFLQEFTVKAVDVRVTVFGEELFAVTIDSSYFPDAKVDFRRAEAYDLPHAVIDLPEAVGKKCVELVRCLGLRFGAIDLLRTPDGEYVFLEINPNGQWYWLEWVTGAPMAKSLCDLLIGGIAA